MNGTAVMTGLACLAYERAEHLSRVACRLTAFTVACLQGNREHFHPRLSELKPHAGQGEAAAWIHADLGGGGSDAQRLQDRYSVRCAPHVIGVLRDALPWIRRDLENEINSANDNPLFDGQARLVLHGGHFYGGHVAFAMDALKLAVASLADLMDRQLALLVDPRYSNGLPANLSGAEPGRAAINHGLKAVQIGASAWTAEALKLTMPASAFSRSTESHNQDKVSLGTIAARDCLRVLELTGQVAAALALATAQGLELRRRLGVPALERLSAGALAGLAEMSAAIPFVTEDRPLDTVLRALCADLQACRWSLYPSGTVPPMEPI
jgi:histidine ammonia-lyase